MKRINSKWSYMSSGFGIALSFLGVTIGHLGFSLLLLACAFFNYEIAEYNRKEELEDERKKSTPNVNPEE